MYIKKKKIIASSTDSTSIASGSIITSEGVGITKNLYVGGLINNTLTTDLTSIASGRIITSGGVGITKNFYVGGIINNTLTNDSTSITSGSIITSEGVGITKNLYVGGIINNTSTTDSLSSITGSINTSGGVGIGKNLYVGTAVNTTKINLNSQSIYSVTVITSLNTYLGNNNLSEVYQINLGNAAIYLPESPSSGTKITIRRIFTGTLACSIYSYNSVVNNIVLDTQTVGINAVSIAASTGKTTMTFVYYNDYWYQI